MLPYYNNLRFVPGYGELTIKYLRVREHTYVIRIGKYEQEFQKGMIF